jgi:hypothetical protein
MKKASLLLLIFVSLTAFTCENETLDFEVEEAVTTNDPTNPSNPSDPSGGSGIVGTWRTDSFSADITSSATFVGITTNIESTMEGINIDYTVTFDANGNFTTEGSYDIATTVTTQGFTDSYTYNVGDVSGTGTYETQQPNIISFSGGFYELNVSGVDTSTFQDEQQEGQYSISADGQTLTITQNLQVTQEDQGVTSTTSVNSISTYTRI